MILILCLDDHEKYCFNHRRQSRDKIQREHLFNRLSGKELHMNEYSLKLYEKEYDNCVVGVGDCYLCEVESLESLPIDIDEVWIYRWNRSYPGEFGIEALHLEDYTLVFEESFKGSSHEEISFEVYKYE